MVNGEGGEGNNSERCLKWGGGGRDHFGIQGWIG